MSGKDRNKGQRGELEWRDVLRSWGYTKAERGQQRHGGSDSPDVRNGIPGTHVEVKRVECLRLHEAMRQAVSEAGDSIPYVASRRNNDVWLVTLRASDLVEFAKLLTERTEA